MKDLTQERKDFQFREYEEIRLGDWENREQGWAGVRLYHEV